MTNDLILAEEKQEQLVVAFQELQNQIDVSHINTEVLTEIITHQDKKIAAQKNMILTLAVLFIGMAFLTIKSLVH